MEIKVGRKYLDATAKNPKFILEVTEVNDMVVKYKARLLKKGSNWHSTLYTERLTSFKDYEPMYTEVKATRLARKMFPNAEEENGMLILEE